MNISLTFDEARTLVRYIRTTNPLSREERLYLNSIAFKVDKTIDGIREGRRLNIRQD